MALIKMLVFNSKKWLENHGDDPKGNRRFWEEAEIVTTYHRNGDLLAVVRWPDGTTTDGHFVSMMKELSEKEEEPE